MKKFTRGEFLGLAGAAVAGAGFGGTPEPPTPGRGPQVANPLTPDLVLLNGRVYTVDDALPRAEAFAVKGGRFVAVGSTDDIRNLVGPGTEVIDAGGMTVTPGFIDAHCHPAGAGVSALTSVDLDVRTIREIKERLRERAQRTPAGEWVLGYKYDDTKVIDESTGRFRQINKYDLDDAVPDHPVYVPHRGGHVYWYNTRALQLAGVTMDTPDPPGGMIYRENGELTGKVAERANDLFSDVVPSGSTREERQAGVRIISEQMTAAGLTSVHDAYTGVDSITAYQDALNAGEMRFRVYMMISSRDDAFESVKRAGLYTGFGNDWARIGGVKFTADGSASGRTMAMSTPYVGRPDDYGILTMTQEEIHEAVEDAHRHDFQVGIHTNGDVAIDMALNAYERVQELWPRPDPRHRLEHCSLVNPDLLRRIEATGSIPTPFWTYVYYHGNKWAEYGPEKMRWMFAHKSFLDYDIPVAGASDYTPGPFEPLMAIQSMVTRTDMRGREWGPNQRITVDQALRIATINGAHASFEEDVKGSITAGKYADFVMLGEDPYEVDPSQIIDIPVARTVVGGTTMHEA